MGAVYRTTDTKRNREVAIEVLPAALANDPARFTRFTREAQILAGLNHPNIATIHGVEDRAVVMELVEGQPLAGPLTADQALPLFNQLIDALECAHEKGIVHRDLKPANIFLAADGRVKVLDFGLARALASEPAAAANPSNSPTLTMGGTEAGLIIGTAGYMSPEQACGQAAGKRADIWAFGLILHEILTGKQLFAAETVSDSLAAVLTKEPDLKNVPPRFRKLVHLCLVKDPRQRLRDISGARLLLEEPAPTHKSGGLPAWALAISALAGAALGIALWLATRPVEKPFVQLSVDLGPDAVLGTRGTVAISPDGQRFAGPVRRPGGQQGLAVRALGQLNGKPLAGYRRLER